MRTAICMPKRNFKSQDDAEVFFAKGCYDIPWYPLIFPSSFLSAWPDWSSMRLDCQKVPWEYILVDPAKPRNMDPKFESSKVSSDSFHDSMWKLTCPQAPLPRDKQMARPQTVKAIWRAPLLHVHSGAHNLDWQRVSTVSWYWLSAS